MTEILRADGHVLSTVKRSHDSDRVMARRQQVSKELAECIEGYRKDLQPDPLGGAPPNEPAIYEHWDARWRNHCNIIAKSSEPVEVDPEAFKRHVDVYKEEVRKRTMEAKPLNALSPEELTEYDLTYLGTTAIGELWIANRFAVVIDSNGAGYLHLPDVADGDDWPLYLVERAKRFELPFQCKRNGMSLQTIGGFVNALGIKGWGKASLKQLALAEEKIPQPRSLWFQRGSRS